MHRLLESPPSKASSSPFSFVMVSHPSAGRDEEVRRQVRSHAANSWRGNSRLSTTRRVGLRPLVPKAQSSEDQRLGNLELPEVEFQAEDGERPHTDQSSNFDPVTSTTVSFLQRSPSPGKSPRTYLGGGRMDPFNSCSLPCNTMESFLLDHCESSYLTHYEENKIACTLRTTLNGLSYRLNFGTHSHYSFYSNVFFLI